MTRDLETVVATRNCRTRKRTTRNQTMMIINGCVLNDGFGCESELRLRLETAREEDDSRPVRLENDNCEQLKTVKTSR
ncbi:hypothetical protein Hanom_Chr08g00721331 [Helianthus anomalus]